MKTPPVPAARAGVLALVLALACGLAGAQSIWKWRDAAGRIQVSDRPPPAEVPERDILQRPGARPVAPAGPEAAGDAAASAPAGVDPLLEARRQNARAEQAAADKARQDAEQARRERQRAEQCARARRQLAALEGGQRIGRMNDQGEREILDDAGRAQEIARYRAIADSACQPRP